MSAITIEVPEPVRLRALRLAESKHLSLDEFLATAVAEGLQTLEDADYFERRAARAEESAFRRILDRVPDVEPEEEWDRVPPEWTAHREEILAKLARHTPCAATPSCNASSERLRGQQLS